jgi:hypothetical protein
MPMLRGQRIWKPIWIKLLLVDKNLPRLQNEIQYPLNFISDLMSNPRQIKVPTCTLFDFGPSANQSPNQPVLWLDCLVLFDLDPS